MNVIIQSIVYYVHREITVFFIWLHLKIFWFPFNILKYFFGVAPHLATFFLFSSMKQLVIAYTTMATYTILLKLKNQVISK
jgi:hypothetical protein